MNPRTIPFPALALTAAVALLAAGCSSTANKSADSGAPAQATAAPPAPPPKPMIEGMGYDELAGVLGDGAGKGLKQDLVGKTVTLSLSKPSGRGAPAGTYVVSDGDSTYFRCRAVGGGFSGGEVVTKIRDYRYVAKPLQRIVDLDRCAVAASAEPARPAAAATTAAAAPAASSGGAGTVGAGKPGMDARGNVVDSSKVEAGSGRTVKGLNDYEGEITGNPGPGSKFTRLQIGMPTRQVTDLIGPPTDQGVYVTGKAFIPFYFGSDRHRYEMTYKGQGRLVFAGGGMGDYSSGNLIWIIHNPNEAGYR
ncbi:hypothetical protein [Variovorax sp. dw_308]|uniref:hypothetical protein n=1 Tax=Variovorax sp. dw_308 TaxID=2721546 RepID=UPI002109FC3B|nr:hypothetical protein [Variovorax sp. dw_308]